LVEQSERKRQPSERIRGIKRTNARALPTPGEGVIDIDYDSVIHRGDTESGVQRPPKAQKIDRKISGACARTNG
jgi:hypothetical protein